MLIEKYMEVKAELPDMEDKYGDPEVYYEEMYISDDEIRHYIDEYLSAEDVLNYAKQIAPEEFKENTADLDRAYEILVDEFDNHDDIEDIKQLNQWIQDSVQDDYANEAANKVAERIEDSKYDDWV